MAGADDGDDDHFDDADDVTVAWNGQANSKIAGTCMEQQVRHIHWIG